MSYQLDASGRRPHVDPAELVGEDRLVSVTERIEVVDPEEPSLHREHWDLHISFWDPPNAVAGQLAMYPDTSVLAHK